MHVIGSTSDNHPVLSCVYMVITVNRTGNNSYLNERTKQINKLMIRNDVFLTAFLNGRFFNVSNTSKSHSFPYVYNCLQHICESCSFFQKTCKPNNTIPFQICTIRQKTQNHCRFYKQNNHEKIHNHFHCAGLCCL